jgi:hypothetical protein
VYATLAETDAVIASLTAEKAAIRQTETTKLARIQFSIDRLGELRLLKFPGAGTLPRNVTLTLTTTTDQNGARINLAWTLLTGTEPAAWTYSRTGADGGWTSPSLPPETRTGNLTFLSFSTAYTVTLSDGEGNTWQASATTDADPGQNTTVVTAIRNTLHIKPGGDGDGPNEGQAFASVFESYMGRTMPGFQLNTWYPGALGGVLSVTLNANLFGAGHSYILTSPLLPTAPSAQEFTDFVNAVEGAGTSARSFVWALGWEDDMHAGRLDSSSLRTAYAARWNADVASMRAEQIADHGTSEMKAAWCGLHQFSLLTDAELQGFFDLLTEADALGFDLYDKEAYVGEFTKTSAGVWTDPEAFWEAKCQPSFDFYVAECVTRGLDLVMPEWAPWFDVAGDAYDEVGGNDNPYFVERLFTELVNAEAALSAVGKHVIAHSHFAQAADVPHDVRVGTNTSAKFLELFGSTGGGGGGGGGNTDNPCVNVNATANAQAVLRYMRSLRGTGSYLTGHWGVVRQFNTGLSDIAAIQASSGQTPAVLGIDYQHAGTNGAVLTEPSNSAAIAHWNAGGLVIMNLHAWDPISQTASYNGGNPSGFNIAQMTVEGTTQNTALKNNLLAPLRDGLFELQNNGVVVILRLWHEWGFWWSRLWSNPTDAALKALWNYSYDWLEGQGVNNCLRMYGPKGDTFNSPSPEEGGSGAIRPDYADIDLVGLSVYELPSTSYDHPHYAEIHAADKPMLLGEFGPGTFSVNGLTAVAGYNGLNLLGAFTDEPGVIGSVSWWDAFSIRYYSGSGVPYMQDGRAINRADVDWQSFL